MVELISPRPDITWRALDSACSSSGDPESRISFNWPATVAFVPTEYGAAVAVDAVACAGL